MKYTILAATDWNKEAYNIDEFDDEDEPEDPAGDLFGELGIDDARP